MQIRASGTGARPNRENLRDQRNRSSKMVMNCILKTAFPPAIMKTSRFPMLFPGAPSSCFSAGALLGVVADCGGAAGDASTTLLGFAAANPAKHRALEKKFDARLDPAD